MAFSLFFIHPVSRLAVVGDSAKLMGQPFTGIAYKFHPGFRPATLIIYWRGQKHGFEKQWYAHGAPAVERAYSHGILEGVDRGWHQNGRVRYYREHKRGQPHGEFWSWHDNGQVADFILYNHGQQLAVKSWSTFGAIHYNYVFRDHQRIGVQGGGYCRTKIPAGS